MEKKKFLYVLSCSSDNVSRATRCFQFARVSQEHGHDTHIFLVDDAVSICNPELVSRIHAPTGDSLEDHLSAYMLGGGKVWVCTPCAKNRNITNIPDGFELSTAHKYLELAAEREVISF
jgi:predicted peroxiredoxin